MNDKHNDENFLLFNDLNPTKLYVDSKALKHNYDEIKKVARRHNSKTEIMPMLKANAYGAGVQIAAGLFRDCKYIAVADVNEALYIKKMLPNSEIVIIYQPLVSAVPVIVANNFICAVSNEKFISVLNQTAHARNKIVRIHIEINSGSNRLGIEVEKAEEFAVCMKKYTNIKAEGVFQHFATSDGFNESDDEFTKTQTQNFKTAVTSIEKILGEIKFKHAANSAGIFNPAAENDFCNMVRPGYMLYGYYPGPALKKYIELKPSIKFATRILQISKVPAESPISYGRMFVTKRNSIIATVAAGYSDGIPRVLSNKGFLTVAGKRCPIVGRVCMDLCMVDVTDVSEKIEVGDEVWIFDNITTTVEEIAEISGTIGYEIISQIQNAVARVKL